MKSLVVFLLGGFLMFGLFGCDKTHDTATGIEVTDVRPDPPELKRKYVVKLNGDVTLTITTQDRGRILGVSNDGELTQGSVFGKWVFFEPERPADKILDRELLPLVEKRCKEILQLDKEFRDSKPDTFTDERGTTWKRQN